MKHIFKYSAMLLMTIVMSTACQDEDLILSRTANGYADATSTTYSATLPFFSSTVAQTQNVSTSSNQLMIPVSRTNTQGELTVPITVQGADGTIYSFPSSVTFKDGEETAYIVVSYNPDDLVYGHYDPITIQIGDGKESSLYGFSEMSFELGATEWEDMGMAIYREALVGDWGFEVDQLTYQVPIQKSLLTEGMYRLVNPYGEYYPYNEPGDYDASSDNYMVINATDPEYVWIDGFDTSMDWGYGTFSFPSVVSYLLGQGETLETVKSKYSDYFGILENGIITMPANSFMGSMSGYADGKVYSGFNAEGLFAIALPGASFKDYSIEYEMKGRFIDLSGQIYAQGVATLGEDIFSAKAALVTDESYEEIYEAVLAGSAGVDVESGKDFFLPFTESGVYYVMILAFDEKGEVVQESSTRVKLDNPAEGAGTTWEATYIGNYYYDLFSSEEDGPYIVEGVTLSVDAGNENHMMLAPWMDATHQLEFFVNEDGSITVPEQETGFDYGGEFSVMDVTSYTEGNPEYAEYVSKIEGSTFKLNLIYFNSSNVFICQDTYTVTGYPEVKSAVKSSVKFASRKMTNISKTKKTMTLKELSLRRYKKSSKPFVKK